MNRITVKHQFNVRFFFMYSAFVMGYMVYNYIENLHTQMNRKNPAEFENDS